MQNEKDAVDKAGRRIRELSDTVDSLTKAKCVCFCGVPCTLWWSMDGPTFASWFPLDCAHRTLDGDVKMALAQRLDAALMEKNERDEMMRGMQAHLRNIEEAIAQAKAKVQAQAQAAGGDGAAVDETAVLAGVTVPPAPADFGVAGVSCSRMQAFACLTGWLAFAGDALCCTCDRVQLGAQSPAARGTPQQQRQEGGGGGGGGFLKSLFGGGKK